MSNILFEDIFDVRTINPDGKKFEGVNRIHCKGTTYDVGLIVDINSELFEIKTGDRTTIAFASTLAMDGTPDNGQYNSTPGPSLLDSYDYVMHGRIFKIEHKEKEAQTILISASFGGLLLRLEGDQSQLDNFSPDMRFYLLMR